MWTGNFFFFLLFKTLWHVFCCVGTKHSIILAVIVSQLKQPFPWQRKVRKWWLWGSTGVMTSIWIVMCVISISILKSKIYLIAQNPFRGEGESLPIHLNLGGWDTSGPNSCWHPTWLWKQTTEFWVLLLSSNSTETSRTTLFNFYIYKCAAFSLISTWVNHHTRVPLVNRATLHYRLSPFQRVERTIDLNANWVHFSTAIQKSVDIWRQLAYSYINVLQFFP